VDRQRAASGGKEGIDCSRKPIGWTLDDRAPNRMALEFADFGAKFV
jgi:hypothetical protein